MNAANIPGILDDIQLGDDTAVLTVTIGAGDASSFTMVPGRIIIGAPGMTASAASPPPIPGASLADIERHAILETLRSVGWSTGKAAAILKISARKIQYRIAEYGVPNPTRVRIRRLRAQRPRPTATEEPGKEGGT